MVENEVWKEIEGFEGKYSVSNCGRVWNNKDNLEVAQVVTGIPQYKYVNLQPYEGKRKLVRVHRLVAKAFLEWDKKYNVVDHIDRDKFNNHVSNLRWTDTSGNQRNVENNLYVGEEYLKDFVLKYESPHAAYSHMARNMLSGLSGTEAVEKYEKWLKYGTKQDIVEWEGKQTYLLDLCNRFGADYDVVKDRMGRGWELWNSIYSIPPNTSYVFSQEVRSRVYGLSYWFPSKRAIEDVIGDGGSLVDKFLSDGYTLEDMIEYDPLDRHRQTIKGVTGTIFELCKHFGVTESALDTRRRKGMSLEEALTMQPLRIKYAVIDGTKKTLKGWYEHFGLEYSKAKAYKDKTQCQFNEELTNFGIDISNLKIYY